jgi:hypothetical protein
MYGWIGRWVDRCASGWMEALLGVWTDTYMGRRIYMSVDGKMAVGWVNKWVVVWKDGLIFGLYGYVDL